MWCWSRTEGISWADRLKNEEALHRIKEERNILHTLKGKEQALDSVVWRSRFGRGCGLSNSKSSALKLRTDVK